MLKEFNDYLTDQIGQPYVWGGQHTKLTPENYKTFIRNKENSEEHAKAAIAYCEKKFSEGATVLYAYDCSGLGMYWLQNVKGIYNADANANTMMHRCVDIDTPEPPEKGWWTFRLNSEKTRATHIGYMIDNEYLVEAKGRAYGVVKTKWRERDWDCWGIPKVFEDEIRHPEPQPPTPTEQFVLVKGGSVWVRDAGSTKGKKLFIAHSKEWYKQHGQAKESDTFPLIDIAPSGWYHIKTSYPESYITNKTRYTILENE